MSVNYSGPPLLYHYTSFDGFLGILESRSLWASDSRFLNDRAEYEYALDLLVAEIDRRLALADDLQREELSALRGALRDSERPAAYVFSASSRDNQLSQWRAYAKAGGVSLGFRPSELDAAASGFKRVTCLYKDDVQTTAIAAYLDSCQKLMESERNRPRDRSVYGILGGGTFTRLYARWIEVALTLKHPGFEEEAESRYVFTANTIPTPFCVRSASGLLVPYTSIQLAEAWDSAASPDPAAFRALPALATVTIGPNTHAASHLIAAVRAAFPANGLSECHLQASEIPYRNLE